MFFGPPLLGVVDDWVVSRLVALTDFLEVCGDVSYIALDGCKSLLVYIKFQFGGKMCGSLRYEKLGREFDSLYR